MVVEPGIQVASIGIPDTLLLMLLALVVFGPRRLPEIGRQIGKLMYEFRKVSNEFKFQMEEELRASDEADRQRKLEAAMAANQAAAAQSASTQATLGIPPHPVSESAPLELAAGTSDEAIAPVDGEVRAETLQVQPPAIGEVVPAPRPFRSHAAEAASDATEGTVTESGAEAARETEQPVYDEGRIGTEVRPGVTTPTERELPHD